MKLSYTDLQIIAALLIIPRSLGAFIGIVFCPRPVPPWLRHLDDIAVALVGFRILAAMFTDLSPGYWSAGIFLFLGIVSSLRVFTLAHYAFILGDHCPPRDTYGDR